MKRRCRAKAGAETTRACSASIRNLASALAHTDMEEEICEFLLGILTPAERARIALRWELVKLLRGGGMSQRRVGALLGVSLCKITRGARELKKGPAGFARVVERGLKLAER